MIELTETFFKVDNFMQEFWPQFQKHLISTGVERVRATQMSVSEMITILILFHSSGYRTFKDFYRLSILKHKSEEFPHAVCYARFIQLIPKILVPLLAFMDTIKSQSKGIAFIDSTHLSICHNRRIERNKVFKDVATRGKSSLGWFFGFKLHLVVNHLGEIVSWTLTQGNVDDRKPVKKLTKNIKGKLYADKGYISKPLFQDLFDRGLKLFTTVRSNMKDTIIPVFDRIMLKKRFLIETINGQLKNLAQTNHSRHRSKTNFLANLVAALAAYQLKPKKPSIRINPNQLSFQF